MQLTIDQNTLIIGTVVPISVLLIVVIVCYIVRRRRTSNENNYRQVKHGLDEEEIEFKRIIESGRTDDIDALFEGDDEELNFDSKDLDRLNMLENYRNNLVAGAKAAMEDENSDIRL